MSKVLFGIDRVLVDPTQLRGRIGLVTNDAARTAQDAQLHSRVALQRAGVQLVCLFSPEHGLGTNAPDGAEVSDSVDSLTRLPVISLYGEKMRPSRESIRDLDAVVFDIPDIGARFYTYIWTLSHVLEACAEAGVPLIVLDRPNPLGGELAAAEGPILDTEKITSFVGRAPIPIRHSLTAGELAGLWNAELTLNADLRVIQFSGWKRAMHWPDAGLPFTPTSPAIASYASALLYPGTCLFEATNLSVGRGTPLSFQAIGAPWLKAEAAVRHFNALNLPSVKAQATAMIPRMEPYANQRCEFVQLVVSESRSFRPVRAGLHLLSTIIATHREQFRWANYPTAANPGGAGHFERLIGQTGIREALEENPAHLRDQIETWTIASGWRERTKPFLLYD